MSDNQYRPPHYPALQFVAQRGKALAIVIGVLMILAGSWQGLQSGQVIWPILGVFLGALVILLLLCFCEISRIIIDTLVPR